MYKTREEIEKAWPLGTVIIEEPIQQRFYCTNEVMLDKIKIWFSDADVQQTSQHHATVTRMVPKTIEGYLYNGDSWYPMTRNGTNWNIYVPEIF